MTHQIFNLPPQQPLTAAGAVLPGSFLYFYLTNTTTPTDTYTTSARNVAHPNPLEADLGGKFDTIYLDPAVTYKAELRNAAGSVLWTIDPVNDQILSQDFIAQYLYPRTTTEISAAVTPTRYQYPPLDPRRYGLYGDGAHPTEDAAAWVSWDAVVGQSSSVGAQMDNIGWQRVEPTNFGLGKNALINCPLGEIENMGIGESALASFEEGLGNLAVGYAAMPVATDTDFCTSVGINSMLFYTTGLGFSVAVGYGAYARGLTGYNNVAIGFESMHDNGAGAENVAIGTAALHNGTNAASSPAPADPSFCTVVGSQALKFGYGSYNTALGYAAMGDSTVTTAHSNVAIGETALQFVTTANSCVGIGRQVGLTKTSGNNDTLVGFQCGYSLGASGGANTMMGSLAGYYNPSGVQNAYFGYLAGQGVIANTGGAQNVAVGASAMSTCGDAVGEVAVGFEALAAVTGTENTCAGYRSGKAITSGAHNTALGSDSAATLTTGSNNVCVGDSADVSGTGATNQNSFGYQAACSGDNQITLGNSSIATIRAQVTTITALSDARFKKKIRALEIPDDAMDELHVVLFDWISADMPQGPQVGFIAQELDAWAVKWGLEYLGLVDKTNPDRWEATPFKLFFPLIKHVQRQSALLKNLLGRVEALEEGR